MPGNCRLCTGGLQQLLTSLLDNDTHASSGRTRRRRARRPKNSVAATRATSFAAGADSNFMPSSHSSSEEPNTYSKKLVLDNPYQSSLNASHEHDQLAAQNGPAVAPCDTVGRIKTAAGGKYCYGDQACITVLPKDWTRRTGDSSTACSSTSSGQVQCEELTGRPWCVSPQNLETFGGPIEIKCPASGKDAQIKPSPTGCWWLKAAAPTETLQRLPGLIKSYGYNAPSFRSGWSLRGDQTDDGTVITPGQAENWAINGRLDEPPRPIARGPGATKGAEFLKVK